MKDLRALGRIALAQINPTIGDLAGNAAKIVAASERARDEGARIVLFPELALTAYGPRDLLDRPGFVRDVVKTTEELASSLPKELTVIVGAPTTRTSPLGRGLHNSAVVYQGGRIVQLVHKRLLPTYDVFDEDRWFEPGLEPGIVTIDGVRIGISICEDIWNDVELMRGRRYVVDPIDELVKNGADVVVNLSGSPFTRQKRLGRGAMLASIAKTHGVPVVMVNQVGAHDDILFDGTSAVFGPDGSVWAQAAAFREDLLVTELAPGGPMRELPANNEAAILDALTMGVRDYAARCGMTRAVLGLSGGIDSALVAVIGARALGAENVYGVAMPSRYSSEGSITDARALAEGLGMPFSIVPIEPLFAPYLEVMPAPLAQMGAATPSDVTFENVQARLRMTILMALANRGGALLLNTGNKSEVACGYCTLYGDMAGGLAVLSDLWKTDVYRVCREVNRQAGKSLIPESTMTKPPSAELRPNQTDQDSLPPYDLLDAILARLIEEHQSPDEIIAQGFDAATVKNVVRLVRISEHKRRQMPPGLILTHKAFGPGRRVPIAQRYGL
jgi:NAD+ synthase (glutamine-hydrolysing)